VSREQILASRAVIEALAPEGVVLRQGKVIGDYIDAYRVGSHLATRQNFQNLSGDEILTAIGPAWREAKRGYPRALGEALARAGLDPDVASLRSDVVRAIIRFYDPLPFVITSQTKRHQ
jgi:hypothetical protein